MYDALLDEEGNESFEQASTAIDLDVYSNMGSKIPSRSFQDILKKETESSYGANMDRKSDDKKFRNEYSNYITPEGRISDQKRRPPPCIPPCNLKRERYLSFDKYVERYGYHIDEIVQYVLDGLPKHAIGGQDIHWDPDILWDGMSRMCYEKSWNKHRGFTLLP